VASVDYKKKLKKIEEIMGQVSNEARLVTLVKSYEKEKEWANEKKKL